MARAYIGASILAGIKAGINVRQGALSSIPMSQTDLSDLGLTSSQIDTRLIYLAMLGLSEQTIDIRGNFPRTAASDAAMSTLTVTQDNEVLEDVNVLYLSASDIDEGNSIGDVIGAISASNDGAYTYSYSLVSGYGDNSSFDIDGSNLEAGEVFDYDTKSSYDIKIRGTNEYFYFEQVFAITVNEVASYPSVLDDGNTEAWYDFAENITKDGSNYVSAWGDKSGNSRDYADPGAGNRPLWSSDGITFDGVDDFMETGSFAVSQPISIYMVLRINSYVNYERILESIDTSTIVFMRTSPSGIIVDAGSSSSRDEGLSEDTFGVIRIVLNGVSSKLTIDSNTPTTGNFGSYGIDGLLLAARSSDYGLNGSITVKEKIVRSVADTSGDETDIYNYLKNKYSL